jgi:hypothetical protein
MGSRTCASGSGFHQADGADSYIKIQDSVLEIQGLAQDFTWKTGQISTLRFKIQYLGFRV